MLKLLLSASMDAVLEATRVLGNLSQSKDVRSVLVQNKGERDTLGPRLSGCRRNVRAGLVVRKETL